MRSTVACALLATALHACAQPDPEKQQAHGQEAYTEYCAACHEVDDGTGPILRPEILASRSTAERLYAYNRMQMPYQAGGTLTDDEYRDITAYLLRRAGLIPENEVLEFGTMDRLELTVP